VCVACAAVAARAQVSTNPNNTIVRFDIFTGGTNVGNLDVELFDQDKPETVKNFLLYLYSGAYSNVLIQTVTTNGSDLSVMQAGFARIENPDSTNTFSDFIQNSSLGLITNEFNAGPVIGNTFGTIATAKRDNQPNSASTSWFINLADNPSLDVTNGGYAVFGRVINTTAPNNGTNLLHFFGTITNLTYALFSSAFFNPLPFSAYHYIYQTNTEVTNITVTNITVTNITVTNVTVTTNIASVQYRDLFTVQASVIRGGLTPERTRPRLKALVPASNVRTTTESNVTFSGTAADNTDVARVVYQTASGDVIIASGTANWSAGIPLRPGTNHIRFQSIDRFGNQSKPVERTIFYEVPVPFALTNIGPGILIGPTNQQLLAIGRYYTLTAKPQRGNFFAGWQGTFTFPSSRITFLMDTGTALTAVFATNPFPRLRGSYFGLITPNTTNSGPRVTGAITLNLGTRGVYSGRLQLLGVSYPIRGAFSLGNVSYITGKRGNSPLALNMSISTNGPASISGQYSDGTESGSVQMYRAENFSEAVAQAGHFTFLVAGLTNSVLGEGFGIGTADVADDGAIDINGTTQDGTDFTQATKIYSGGHFPLFVRRSASEGILGWMTFETNNNAFHGVAEWVNTGFFPTNSGEPFQVTGSRFIGSTNGESPLGWTNGVAELDGGNLPEPIRTTISLDGNGIVIDTNSVNLELSTDANGRVTGHFVHPGTQTATPVQGVLVPEINVGAGFFVGTNRSGGFRLRPTQ
jgi:cyclophilin family peptidyl-prolyl cis-trans isomerase